MTSFVIKPNSFKEAYALYISVPNYSLKNFLKKERVVFGIDEIKSIHLCEKHPYSNTALIQFRTNYFYGFISYPDKKIASGIDLEVLTLPYNQFKKVHLKAFRSIFLFLFCPFLFPPLLPMILIAVLFYFLHPVFFQLIFSDAPTKYVNEHCDLECIMQSLKILKFVLIYTEIYLTVLVSCTLSYFLISKLYRNAAFYISIRRTSFIVAILFTVCLGGLAKEKRIIERAVQTYEKIFPHQKRPKF